MSRSKTPIAITVGEPAGIGPDIALQLLQSFSASDRPLVLVTDPTLLEQRAAQLQQPCALPLYDPARPAPVSVYPVFLSQPTIAGQPNPVNARFVLDTLTRATQGCLNGEFAALVTGPVSKAVINQAGVSFQGHTGYLADLTRAEQALMLFVNEQVRVALLTTHLPLAQVPAAVTSPHLRATLQLLQRGLQQWFGCASPRIAVTGLNPHAGENGYLGSEEITCITPTLEAMRAEGYDLLGPLSADTVFLTAKQQGADAILSMYHDQSLPVLKTMGFGDLVNVTLGLPIIRTSVDHGTAFELAGTGQACADSLLAATRLAMRIVEQQS